VIAKQNFVDERYELISVIFKLAGNWEYNIGLGGLEGVKYPIPDEQLDEASRCEHTNSYQLEVTKAFKRYANHQAVLFAKDLAIGFSNPFRFAMHIKKDGNKFVFIDDISSLTYDTWTLESAQKFLSLYNQFYNDTGYANFYATYAPYFEKLSQTFYNNYYHTVDFSWYSKYVDVSNLRCILSPSNTLTNYAATVNDRIIYALIRVLSGSILIHEFNHSFANPLADLWYAENKVFKQWCDESITEKMPYYSDGLDIAREYVTHAYHILYEHQHGGDPDKALVTIKNAAFENSFPYIEDIYKMVLTLEKIEQN